GDEVGHPVERAIVEEERAEQRLLGLDRMRRNLQREKLRVAAFRARCIRGLLCERDDVCFPPRRGMLRMNGAALEKTSRAAEICPHLGANACGKKRQRPRRL